MCIRDRGEGAAREIARGIELANRLSPSLDVLVVGRGGGSLEDLWSFNEEIVVRAIHASRVPVVSAVGHEIDVTLADLVADVRALTPSEAAERVIPSADEWTERLHAHRRRMVAMLRSRASHARQRLDQVAKSRVFRNPKSLIYDLAHRLDELDFAAARALGRQVNTSRDRLAAIACRIEALSPLAVLARGYSVTTNATTGEVLTSADDVRLGELLQTRLAQGTVTSRVSEGS
jgi:exodeoxyribonuclease VII large subunit